MVARTIQDANNELIQARVHRATNLADAKQSLSKSAATEVFGDLYKLRSLIKQRDIARADNLPVSVKELGDRIQILCKKLAKNTKVLGKLMDAYQEDLYRNEGKELQAMRALSDSWEGASDAERALAPAADLVVPSAEDIAKLKKLVSGKNMNLHGRKALMADLEKGADSSIFKLLTDVIPQDKLSEQQLMKRHYRMDDAACDKAYKKAADKVDNWLQMKAQEAQSDTDLTASKAARPATKAALQSAQQSYRKVGGFFRFFKRRYNQNAKAAYNSYSVAKDADKAVKKDIEKNQKLYERAQKATSERRAAIDGKISSSLPPETNRSMQEYIKLNENGLVTADAINDARANFRGKFAVLRDVHKSINAEVSAKLAPVAPAAPAPVAAAMVPVAAAVPPPAAANVAPAPAQPQANVFDDDDLDAQIASLGSNAAVAPAVPAAPAGDNRLSAAARAANEAEVNALLDELSEDADLVVVNDNNDNPSVSLPAASAAVPVPQRPAVAASQSPASLRSASDIASAAKKPLPRVPVSPRIVIDEAPEALPGEEQPEYQVGDIDVAPAQPQSVDAARQGLRPAANEQGVVDAQGGQVGGYSAANQADNAGPAVAGEYRNDLFKVSPAIAANAALPSAQPESTADSLQAGAKKARPTALRRPVPLSAATIAKGAHALPSIRPAQLRQEQGQDADIDVDALEAEIAADAARDAADLRRLEGDVLADQDKPVEQQVEALAAEMNPGKVLRSFNAVFSAQLRKLERQNTVPAKIESTIRKLQSDCDKRRSGLDAFEMIDEIEQHQDFSSHMDDCLVKVKALNADPNPAEPETMQAKSSRVLNGLKEFHTDWANERGLAGPEQAAQRDGYPPAGSRNMANTAKARQADGGGDAPKSEVSPERKFRKDF